MPTILSDPPLSVYLFLAAALLVSGLIWLNRRSRGAVRAVLAVLAVLSLMFLLDQVLETPREESVRRVHAMMAAADQRNPEAFVSHIADKMIYQGDSAAVTFTREQIRNHYFWSLLRHHNVHVAAWDFSRNDVSQPDANSVEIGFLAKGEAEGKQIPFYFRATFTRQTDGQLKMTRLASFEPMQRTNKPVTIPQLGSN